MFEKLTASGSEIANKAAIEARDRLLARAALPAGVTAEPIDGGIKLTGKALRHRMIDDAYLRNLGR